MSDSTENTVNSENTENTENSVNATDTAASINIADSTNTVDSANTESKNGQAKSKDVMSDTRPSLMRLPIMILITILLVVLDQVTKALAVSGLKGKPSFVLIPGVLELMYLENDGAAFSMLKGQQWFFYLITAAFLIMAIWFTARTPKRRRYDPLLICITVLVSGAIGNLIDRILHKYVVDFIYFSLIDFPVFNMADIYVTVSVTVLVILVLFFYKESEINEIFDIEKKS